MSKKKRPGYYWRLRKRLMQEIKQEQTIFLNDYPNRAKQYIVIMAFKDLPYGIKIVN